MPLAGRASWLARVSSFAGATWPNWSSELRGSEVWFAPPRRRLPPRSRHGVARSSSSVPFAQGSAQGSARAESIRPGVRRGGFTRSHWSRHSDLNRGPAVYELRGPRHPTRLCNVLHRPFAQLPRGPITARDHIVASASIWRTSTEAPSVGADGWSTAIVTFRT